MRPLLALAGLSSLWLMGSAVLPTAADASSSNCPPASAMAPLPPRPAEPVPAVAVPGTYSHLLTPTPWGWPVRDQWCVWVEPPREAPGTAAAQREQQWLAAVEAALQQWSPLIRISRVADAEAAQLRIWRRRPPLQRLSNGRTRASNGRAVLQLLLVERQQRWQAEPRVEVLLGTSQGPQALQATALHELGHAFGLWAHSDQAGDAMAAQAGAVPVLRLSERDRRTLQWLLNQPGRLQTPPERPENRATAR